MLPIAGQEPLAQPACPSLAAACAVIAPRDSDPTPPWAMRLAWMKDMTAKCNFKSFTHANRYSCDTLWLILSTNIYMYITRAHVCEACFLQKKGSFFWNCLIVLLLRLAAQQCAQPQSSTYGGHECEEDVRCHGGVPESTNVWVCLLL